MILSTVRSAAVAFFLKLFYWDSSAFCGQGVGQTRFQSLATTDQHPTPLVPANGAKAVVVYGKDAPSAKAAAEALPKAVADWCGAKLELADDRPVTGEEIAIRFEGERGIRADSRFQLVGKAE